MLPDLPLAFAEHLQPGAVDVEVQEPVPGALGDLHRQAILPLRESAVVRRLPTGSSQTDRPPPRHPLRRPQWSPAQHLQRQQRLDRHIREDLRPTSPARALLGMPGQIGRGPDHTGHRVRSALGRTHATSAAITRPGTLALCRHLAHAGLGARIMQQGRSAPAPPPLSGRWLDAQRPY